MVKAYSYLRFSTGDQMHGDSIRRQKTKAEDYCKANNLQLDTELKFQDLGVSAFRGSNIAVGKLAEFLHCVSTGIVPQGAYLLVENLDRLSRQTARKALRTLEQICEAGITVVTLNDGRKYTAENLDEDPLSLMISILTFMRSHEESSRKSDLITEAWKGKRLKTDVKLTARCPAWLQLSQDRKSFLPIPERAKVVRWIFDLFLKGSGHTQIVKTLTTEGVEPFGNGLKNKRGGVVWHTSYIRRILQTPAVYGEFTPHIMVAGKRVPLEPMPGYYPAVIPELDFQRASELSKNKGITGRTSKELRNIFSMVGKCPTCGQRMIRICKNSEKGWEYLVCSHAKQGEKSTCKYVAVRYQPLESRFINVLKIALPSMPEQDGHHNEYLQEMVQLRYKATRMETTLQRYNDLLLNNPELPETTIKAMRALESEKVVVDKAIKVKALEVRGMSRTVVLNQRKELIAVLHAVKLDKKRTNALLRGLCKEIQINKEKIVMTFSNGTVLNIYCVDSDRLFDWQVAPIERVKAA